MHRTTPKLQGQESKETGKEESTSLYPRFIPILNFETAWVVWAGKEKDR